MRVKIIPAREIRSGDVVAQVLGTVKRAGPEDGHVDGKYMPIVIQQGPAGCFRADDEFVLIHRPDAAKREEKESLDWLAIYAELAWSPPEDLSAEIEEGTWGTTAALPDSRRLTVFFKAGNGFMALCDGEPWATVPTAAVKSLLEVTDG
jgi:hypothetical protein